MWNIKEIVCVILIIISLTLTTSYAAYQNAGDWDKIIEKYLSNQPLTQEEINHLKNDTITSTYYDASVIEMAKEAALNGTIKTTTSQSGSSNSSSNQSNTSNSNNTSGGSSYWGGSNQQFYFDRFTSISSGDVQAIVNMCKNAPQTAIDALTTSQVNSMLNVLDRIIVEDESIRPSTEELESLNDFLNRVKNSDAVNSDQRGTINNLQNRIEEVKDTSQREDLIDDLIDDPNTGAVNPDDIPEQPSEEDPMKGHLGNSDPSASHTVDEIMNEADGFLNTGKEETVPVNGENVRVGSGILYNILLAIAVVAAVVIGLYLGIKFMMSSAEDRAKVKEALIPYIAGCVVIFASFTIWKLVISILGNVA